MNTTTERRLGRPPRDFDRDAALKMIAEGATVPEAAGAFKVAPQTIQRMVQKIGGIETLRARRRTGMEPDRLAKMRAMRAEGATFQTIGSYFGVSRAAVCEALSRPRRGDASATPAR